MPRACVREKTAACYIAPDICDLRRQIVAAWEVSAMPSRMPNDPTSPALCVHPAPRLRCLELIGCVLLAAIAGCTGTPVESHASPNHSYRIVLNDRPDTSEFPWVTVRFNVYDSQGRLVRSLPDSDIIILEDGKEVYRDRVPLQVTPMDIMLVLDTSGSMRVHEKIQKAQEAAKEFINSCGGHNRIGLILFHHVVYRTRNLEEPREQLLSDIADAKAHGGTAYLQAADRALDELEKAPPDRQRALVLMTDGRDNNSRVKLREVLERAQQQKARLYTVGLGRKGVNKYVRTVLVLDRSGSMAERNKIAALKRAAHRYIELLPADSADTALIAFDDQIERLCEFTTDRDQLARSVTSLTPRGQTALHDAILAGLDLLQASDRSDALPNESQRTGMSRAVIALTDGSDNASKHPAEEVIRRAKQMGIPVHMLGFGQDTKEFNGPLIQAIASATGGRYYVADDAGKLLEIFEELAIDLHDDGIDEQALATLARETGGQHFHVEEAPKLQDIFARISGQLSSEFSIRFRSRRPIHDGTARGIAIHISGRSGESLASGAATYHVRGLLVATGERRIEVAFVTLFGILMALMIASRLRRPARLPGTTGPAEPVQPRL
ncbi:MAG: hypothetical protein C4296_09900 [Gemmataceae bacterium]